MNQYYTPSTEELHIGIEIEYMMETESAEPDEQGNVPFKWDARIIKDGYQFIDILRYNKIGKVRVKYLDQQDIEELGWKPKEKNNYSFEKDNLVIIWDSGHFTSAQLAIYITYIINDKPGWFQVFDGKVKNKSELKKLLQQIQD